MVSKYFSSANGFQNSMQNRKLCDYIIIILIFYNFIVDGLLKLNMLPMA